MYRTLLIATLLLPQWCLGQADSAATQVDMDSVRVAVMQGDPETQDLALKFFYARLYAGGAARDEALSAAQALEPYIADADARAEFQERIAGGYRDAGNRAEAETWLDRLQTENPDPATEWGYHAQYARAFDALRAQDFGAAAALFEPLLPYSDGVPGQRARIGVQLTNVYRLHGDFDKAIVLGELTRSKLEPGDPRMVQLVSDLAESYYETGNFALAAQAYEETAQLAGAAQDPAREPEATLRGVAPERARQAREMAEAQRALAAAQAEPALLDARTPVPAVTPPSVKIASTAISRPVSPTRFPAVPKSTLDAASSGGMQRTAAAVAGAALISLIVASIYWRWRKAA